MYKIIESKKFNSFYDHFGIKSAINEISKFCNTAITFNINCGNCLITSNLGIMRVIYFSKLFYGF